MKAPIALVLFLLILVLTWLIMDGLVLSRM